MIVSKPKIILLAFLFFLSKQSQACSILYYKDSLSGKIYALNNEDYWYDVKPYISIVPGKAGELSRLWYGWDNFAQGGVNEAGLFFDVAVTPKQKEINGYSKAKNNFGDHILAQCKNMAEVLALFEKEKIAYNEGHFLFGDREGNAVVIEWVEGEQKLIYLTGNYLMATNFLLSAPEKGNYPCLRYQAMEKEIKRLHEERIPVGLKEAGNILAKAIQPASMGEKRGGTLYSTFINLTDMQFVVMVKYDNNRMTKLDLKQEFQAGKKRTIKLE
jgi:penicillin V acylase-like amidase (Ntn superfamily)